MKAKLYLLLLAPVLMLASCTKWVDTPHQNIVGQWQITSVERQTQYGSEYVYSGYENGVFYFNNNGNAEFSDNFGRMTGSWRMVNRSDGYGGQTQSLELRLYDYYNDDAIEWEFYSVDVSGSRMIGYMNRFGYEYRYEFRRY